ncbi:hypothetical protein [Streptomyces sp. NPDC047869]|uniref:hypothetical protein n=1 Tax=Streptomyces sp. NPDC047869 TaxID=3154709 RepID=UPI0034569A99
MTDHDESPEVAAPAGPATPAMSAAIARKPGRRGRVAAVVGSVLLAGAVLAGAGWTVVTVRGADRDAGGPAWKFPQAEVGKDEERARHGLAGMLVPYGTGTWVRGPDMGEFGSDTQLNGAQATALRKRSLSGLPRSERTLLERQIDRQRIKGMAMRSYYSGQSRAYLWNEEIYTVSIVLAQVGDSATVRNASRYLHEALSGLRSGPKIKGYEKDAACVRPPKGGDQELDGMFCTAFVGDVVVTVTAYGARPLDADGVAKLVRTQLDRIDEPGKAV